MIQVIDTDRSRARELKQAVHGHVGCTVYIVDKITAEQMGLSSLPALVWYPYYPDKESEVDVLLQGTTAPSQDQLTTISQRIAMATGESRKRNLPQYELIGSVIDSITGEPVYSADITYADTRMDKDLWVATSVSGGSISNHDGKFSRTLGDTEVVEITVSAAGYEKMIVQVSLEGGDREVAIPLTPIPGASRERRLRREYSGVIHLEFEGSRFIPDQKFIDVFQAPQEDAIKCWPKFTPAAKAQLEGLDLSSNTFWASFRGQLLGPGHHGHMGLCNYEILVEKLFSAFPAQIRNEDIES